MKNYLKHEIIAIPTDKNIGLGDIFKTVNLPSPNITNDVIGKFIINVNNKLTKSNELFQAHHLYVISKSQKLKSGDYIIENIGDKHIISKHSKISMNENTYMVGKIIASTDKSLKLPTLSKGFINKWIEEDGIINQVLVKYNFISKRLCKLIVRAKNNTIVIKSIKNTYTIDEVRNKILEIFEDKNVFVEKDEIIDWCNKNL